MAHATGISSIRATRARHLNRGSPAHLLHAFLVRDASHICVIFHLQIKTLFACVSACFFDLMMIESKIKLASGRIFFNL